MARKKLSELRAKQIVSEALGREYVGWSVTSEADLTAVKGFDRYVLKVDQAEKQRFKKGLVALDVSAERLAEELQKLQQKDYQHFIVEPYLPHESSDERYLALTHGREGTICAYSARGGVDIEAHVDAIERVVIDETTDYAALAQATDLAAEGLKRLTEVFATEHMTLLEINPYVTRDGLTLLDAAIEVDYAAAFFATRWTAADVRTPRRAAVAAEQTVAALDDSSPASFSLSVLDPDGSIFLLLSGGGASVVVADEIYLRGHGAAIANYGEYSGNPTADETYHYTRAVLELVRASSATDKKLFIGGAVANFTDIANTFAGVIRALDELTPEERAVLTVSVRRGGPRQELGLKRIAAALRRLDIYGDVSAPDVSIGEAVRRMIEGVDGAKGKQS